MHFLLDFILETRNALFILKFIFLKHSKNTSLQIMETLLLIPYLSFIFNRYYTFSFVFQIEIYYF